MTLGHGHVPGLGGARWLDDDGAGDRLPQPGVAGLASIAKRQIEDGRVGAGAGADRAVRHVRACTPSLAEHEDPR